MSKALTGKGIVLPLGFALIILMMIVATYLGVSRMRMNNALMEEVVTEHNVKINLVRNMYTAARERSVLLLRMLQEEDPFERDDMYLEFNRMAGIWDRSREQLVTMEFEPPEQDLLEGQWALTAENAPLQSEVVDLIVLDQIQQARTLLFEKAIPGQNKILERLRLIIEYEQELARKAYDNAARASAETTRFIYLLAAGFLVLSLAIAAYVIRRTRQDAASLIEARDTLEDKVEERTRQLSDAYEDVKHHQESIEAKNRELESLSSKLSKYLSPQVYSSIFSGQQEVRLASERKKLTVLFADIVGFTRTTDRMEPEDLTLLLNQYFTEMTTIALQHGGTIDKYIGDAIMLFFGDPETRGVKDDALACARAALRMQKRLEKLQGQWLAAGLIVPISCRIGIHTGYCTVGNFGSDDKMEYTIIGGTVNLASRLEHEAPPGGVLVSSDTYSLIGDVLNCTPMGQLDIRGIAYPVETFQVLGETGETQERGEAVSARSSHMRLELDAGQMTEAERKQATDALKEALKRLDQG